MDASPVRGSQPLARTPFASCLSILSPHLPDPSSGSKRLSRLDQAISTTHEWCTKLSRADTAPGVDTVDAFCSFLSHQFFDYKVDSASCFSTSNASATANRDATSPHGPRPRPPAGMKVAAMVHVMKELITELNERAAARDGDWWYQVGVALGDGLAVHLEENDVGKRTSQDLAYRTYLCFEIAEPLVRMVVPDPTELPKSSADDLGGLGKNAKEMAAKYSALDVLGNLLSKNEQNKSVVMELFPPGYLGSILHAGFDHHLSHLTFELAFRLLPPKRLPEARKEFLQQLFADDVFGKGKEDLAKSLRKRMDNLDVSSAWVEGYQGILKRISEMHIRRSQFFKVVSMEYDSNQLLLPRERAEASFDPQHGPSLSEVVDGVYYDSELLWISRHILAATITVAEGGIEGDESVERMVVPLAGVRKVFVVDLDKELEHEANLGCLRVTFLVDASTPLTTSSKPHPSEPSHLGSRMKAVSETQGLEFEAAGSGLDKYHELVVLIKRDDAILKILSETLMNRGKQYPRLVDELSDFPKHSAPTQPAAPPKAVATTNATSPSLPRNVSGGGQAEAPAESNRRVTFATSPNEDRNDTKQKGSDGAERLESRFPGDKSDEVDRSSDHRDAEENEEDRLHKRASQENLRQRRDTVASMAAVEGSGASEVGDSIESEAAGVEVTQAEKAQVDKGQAPVKGSSRRAGGGSAPIIAIAPKRPDASSTLKVREKKSTQETGQEDAEAGDDSSELSELESNGDGEELRWEKEVRPSTETRAVGQGRNSAAFDNQELAPPPKKVVASYSSRRRSGTTDKDTKKSVSEGTTRPAVDVEKDESEAARSNRSAGPNARSPAASKKVVAPQRLPEARKTAVLPPTGKKRVRSSSSREQDQGEPEGSSENEDGGGTSSDDDLVPPDKLGQGQKKKVVKAVTRAKPAPKRRKLATNAGKDDVEEETDYEAYLSLEKKRVAPSAAKKYGKDKTPGPRKTVGATKKAGKGNKRRGPTKRENPVEEEDGTDREEKEGGQEQQVGTTKIEKRTNPRPRRAVAIKRKGATIGDHPSDVSSEETQVEGPDHKSSDVRQAPTTDSAEATVGGKPSTRVSGKASPTLSTAPSPAKKGKPDRMRESTPPPFDVSAPALGHAKHRPPPSVSETASNAPRKSFAELLQVPRNPAEPSLAPVGGAEEEDFGGFEQDFSVGEGIGEESAQLETLVQARPAEPNMDSNSRSRQGAGSLSPVPHPATTDFSFADRAFAQPPAIGAHGKADQPRVLVEDTPAASAEQAAGGSQDGATFLGNHKITSQRARTESPEEDVEMDDGGENEEGEEMCDGDDEEGAGGDPYEGVGLADDSGLHFNPPIDKGTEGEDEANHVYEEEGDGRYTGHRQSSESEQNRHAAQISSARAKSRVSPGPSPARPLLVTRTGGDRFHSAGPPFRPAQPQAPSIGPRVAPVPRVKPHARVESRRSTSTARPSRQTAADSNQPTRHLPHRPAAPPSMMMNPARARHPTVPTTAKGGTSSRQAKPRQAQSKKQATSTGGSKGTGTRVPPRASRPALRFEDEQRTGVEPENDDFDEDDEELYDSLLDFADIMTRKNRDRRRERQEHHASSKIRFEEPLIQFMNNVFDETNDLLSSVRTLSTNPFDPTSDDTRTAAQRLLTSAATATAKNDALWRELEQQLSGFGMGETPSRVGEGHIGGDGGGALRGGT